MAKIIDHVTSAKGDNELGPLLFNPDLSVPVSHDTDFSTDGWVKLGYGSTDGVSAETDADDTDKNVWGATLGTIYSNFTDTLTLHCASFMDPDLWKIIAGDSNVTTDAATGYTTIKRKNATVKGTFVVVAKSDAGKKIMWIYRGQTSPAFSYDATGDDVITFDLEVHGIAADDGTTSTLLLQTADPKPASNPSSGK